MKKIIECRRRLMSMAVLLFCASAQGIAAPPEPKKHEAPRACELKPYFDCRVPAGWSTLRDPEFSANSEKVFGLELIGPRAPSGAYVRIDADYYAPGNRVHKTPEKFIRVVARLDGGIGLPGEKGTAPERVEFKGKPATRFTRTTFDFIRVTKTSDKQVTIQEEYLVIPAEKGFYVLEYTAPPNLVKEYRPVFERFKESFTMLVK